MGKFLLLMLALVWVPSTTHCLLEGAGVIAIHECCQTVEGASAPSRPSCEYQCSSLESASYQLPNIQTELPTFSIDYSAVSAADLLPLSEPVLALLAPPELSTTWQFSVRAAPSPRAPAVVS